MRAVTALAAVLVAGSVGIGPASAGGSWLAPVQDRYEAGAVATLVGYTGGPQPDAHRVPGPYRAFLQDGAGTVAVEVGTLELTDLGPRGWASLRVAVRFTIPPDTAPGHYVVTYCVDACARPVQLGDLVGGLLSVGVDPPFPVRREWPIDEPEIANLDDDARLTGPGYETTTGAVRAGIVPSPTLRPAPVPAAPPEPIVVETLAPRTTGRDGPPPVVVVVVSAVLGAGGFVVRRNRRRRAGLAARTIDRPAPVFDLELRTPVAQDRKVGAPR